MNQNQYDNGQNRYSYTTPADPQPGVPKGRVESNLYNYNQLGQQKNLNQDSSYYDDDPYSESTFISASNDDSVQEDRYLNSVYSSPLAVEAPLYNKKKKDVKMCCCRVPKIVCCVSAFFCVLIVIAIIVLIVIIATFKVPTFTVNSITQGTPQYEVSKNGLSKRQLFANLFNPSGSFSVNDIPENTLIKANIVAEISINNQNWFGLPINNQKVDIFVTSDMDNPIGSGVLRDSVPANQKLDNSVDFQIVYLKQGNPPESIQYLFANCDGSGKNIDLTFTSKIYVKTITIEKTLPCPINLQDSKLKQQIQSAQ
eukprot:NODE_88_length_21932_cov_0.317867.p8 type:complete len:312 gc:universal NODE_88_length_21932_cov_0.317867:6529-7464(+)